MHRFIGYDCLRSILYRYLKKTDWLMIMLFKYVYYYYYLNILLFVV